MLSRARLLLLATPLLFGACGISKKDHDAQVQSAVDAQKATCDAEMQKMQAAHGDAIAAKDKDIQGKETMINGLGSEIEKMGGDLKKVRTELGDRTSQLASTKVELAATNQEVEQLRKLRADAEREAAQFKALTEKFKSMIDAGQLQVVIRKGRINLKLPDNVLFPSGSKKLKKEGLAAVETVAATLKDMSDRDFLIAGHTDNVPMGKGGNNWDLSTARAVEVVQMLIKNGVPPGQLSAAGFGEFDPIEDNATKEGREKNRRLEIILLPRIEKIPGA
jgi:chemotaxis protein MotB